jgi:hypothetical protein
MKTPKRSPCLLRLAGAPPPSAASVSVLPLPARHGIGLAAGPSRLAAAPFDCWMEPHQLVRPSTIEEQLSAYGTDPTLGKLAWL